MNSNNFFVRIEFENCETVCVLLGERSDSYVRMDNVIENVESGLNGLCQYKEANCTYLALYKNDLMSDKKGLFSERNDIDEMWSRLQQYDDITHLSFYNSDGFINSVAVKWNDNDEERNSYQKTTLNPENNWDKESIEICIDKNK